MRSVGRKHGDGFLGEQLTNGTTIKPAQITPYQCLTAKNQRIQGTGIHNIPSDKELRHSLRNFLRKSRFQDRKLFAG
jgi:hypothetical protein